MKFFLDNNLSRRQAVALNALSTFDDPSHQVVHLTQKFDPSTPDETWIPALGEEGNWVVISGDVNIKKRPAEARVFRASKLTTFFLAKGWMNVGFWEQSYLLVRWWPKIIAQSKIVQPGAIFQVPYKQPGKFEQI